MASPGPTDSGVVAEGTGPQEITNAPRPTSGEPTLSTPVEMSTLESKVEASPTAPSRTTTQPAATTSPPQKENESQRQTPAAANPSLDRTVSTAIGPSSDQPTPIAKDTELTGPTLMITLLLTSSGARHPFKLDSKYLNRRSVKVADNDPYNLSVYTLKELILREWRDEWEQKPTSPSSIRLISFGKLLDDKAPLKDSKFSADAPNVVHMTIKPQEIVDEEDAKGGKGALSSRDREGSERSPGCRCVIL